MKSHELAHHDSHGSDRFLQLKGNNDFRFQRTEKYLNNGLFYI